mgnify:FL=1
MGWVTPARAQTQFTLYLIGDAGEPTPDHLGYQDALREQLKSERNPFAVIFLGDNIYPKGLPDADDPSRMRYEAALQAQLAMVQEFGQPVFFIPGNHDWKKGKPEGWTRIRNQQRWFDSLRLPHVQFLPKSGCPGPEEIILNEETVLVIVDTQWLLHPWEKPEGDASPCEAKTLADVLVQMEDIFKRHRGKRMIVAGHHPIHTYGEHGGVFTWKHHLFPLSYAVKGLYLPLPGVGSIMPLYRKWIGNIQDTPHPQYRQWARAFEALFQQYPGTVYVAGHEHALQSIFKDSVHYLVSGSGSKSTVVKKKRHANFISPHRGFARLVLSKEHASTAFFWAKPDGERTSLAYTQPLVPVSGKWQRPGRLSRLDSTTVRRSASRQYVASRAHQRWLGKNYRAAWSQPIDVPVFRINQEHGGLQVVQRGGGQQTISLRLQDAAGREYTLRSIEKYPEKAVPEAFRKTFAQDLVQDQISASHPYGALVVPFLAEAAGVYHTNPKVVWVPDDPEFGPYQTLVANQLMLFEERPAGDGRELPFFGNPEKIVSTDKVLEKLAEDNRNRIDQPFVLKSRLFDLWLGDWDRHDDQWRWAQQDDKSGKRYQPIPRDRDQAFFVNEGILPPFWGRKWALAKFQGFDETLKDPAGFMFNGRYFDRSFLNGLSKADWISAAAQLQLQLTDEVIDAALKKWPPEIYALHGARIAEKLKKRKADLPAYAARYYDFLAREVDISGSDKKEDFKVAIGADGSAHVQMFESKGKKNDLLFSRTFHPHETKEIRLYGLGGDDDFFLEGARTPIRLRVIGGKGEDEVENEARERPFVYDRPKGMKLKGGARSQLRTDPRVNEYNRKAFTYDRLAPLLYGNFNVDDGVFVGGGFLSVTHGFRKTPFKSRHLFLASYAVNTSSYNFQYDGRWTHVFGKWNLEADADIKAPNFVNNFFGLGNETVFNRTLDDDPNLVGVENSIDYYRLRFTEYKLEARLARPLGSFGMLKFGPVFQHVEIEDTRGRSRFIADYASQLTFPVFESGRNYMGLVYALSLDQVNHPIFTTRGIRFHYHGKTQQGVNNSDLFSSHQATFALYQSFRLPARVTFAWRVGAGTTLGDFPFFQAQILDGKTELRGFRKTRFYGDSELFFNHEVRVKLANIRSYVFPAAVGLLAFYDVGRVWYKDANGNDPSTLRGRSALWHQGVGVGVWFTPFGLTVLSLEVGRSRESVLAYVRLGYLF